MPATAIPVVASGGEDQSPFPSSAAWAFARWIFSVLVMSTLMTLLTTYLSSGTTVVDTTITSPPPAPVVRISRRSTCTAGGVDTTDYDLPLHVGAVFIIFFASFMACVFPLLAKRFPSLRIPARFFFAVRHFGTGVLIATAFVHLLPTAFISLGDPCLGGFWTEDYPAMPGAIALAAVFFVTVIEMVFHPSRRAPPMEFATEPIPEGSAPVPDKSATSPVMLPMRNIGPLRGRSSSIGQGLFRLTHDESGGSPDEAVVDEDPESQIKSRDSREDDAADKESVFTIYQQRKERLQVILLEMGILFHSIFIGMALSVSLGSQFIILLIAIVFHRELLQIIMLHR